MIHRYPTEYDATYTRKIKCEGGGEIEEGGSALHLV